MKKINVGIIIPDRNDRGILLMNCIRMIEAQIIPKEINLQVDNVRIINFDATDNACDITKRYRIGYESFKDSNIDCILLMENDDFYHVDYISTMVNAWINHDCPDVFGTNYTYYYHVGMLCYEKFTHNRRASAMNTLLKPNLDIKWPVDSEPYTDIHIWKHQTELRCATFQPNKIISIGIKHGIGKTGGHYHNDKLERYHNQQNDSNMEFLKTHMDETSFNFYKKIHEKIRSNFN